MSTGVEEKKDPPAGPAMPSDKSVGDAAVAIAKAGLQSVPLIGGALQLSPDESERQMFLEMIDRFTVWHLRLLKAFDNPPTWAKTNGVSYRPAMTSSLSGFLEAAFPELRNRRDLYDQVWSELGVAGLHATGGRHTMRRRPVGSRREQPRRASGFFASSRILRRPR